MLNLAKTEHYATGMLHLIDKGAMYASRGRSVYRRASADASWQLLCSLPVGTLTRLQSGNRYSARLLRLGITHIRVATDNGLIVAGFGRIWRFELDTGQFTASHQVAGRRIMNLAQHGNLFCYGEYASSDPVTRHIAVVASDDGARSWHEVRRFDDIRHVHTVCFDPYAAHFWITTGDTDQASGFWVADAGLNTFERVLGGSQMTRAVQPVFTASHVYYGTDTLEQQNYLFRFERNVLQPERLMPVNSAVFYGTKIGERIYFASDCETKTPNDKVCLYGSAPGGSAFSLIGELKKDFLPRKYFQYGNIIFPETDGSLSDHLYFSPFATVAEGSIRRIDCGQLP